MLPWLKVCLPTLPCPPGSHSCTCGFHLAPCLGSLRFCPIISQAAELKDPVFSWKDKPRRALFVTLERAKLQECNKADLTASTSDTPLVLCRGLQIQPQDVNERNA